MTRTAPDAKEHSADKGAALRDLTVELVDVDSLTPYGRNARRHTRKQIRKIADSIEEFGWTNPVLVDGQGGIIAGHGRVEAARLLGLSKVPTIRLEHLTEAHKRAYIIADNRLAELAGWNEEILALELQGLTEVEIDFDATITGFEVAEIDLLIESLKPAGDDDPGADALPEEDLSAPPVSEVEDLWILDPHRLLCGDATVAASFDRLMGTDKAQMVFVDPPYNLPINGHVCGSGAIKHEDFVMASGEMSEAEFTAFLEASLTHLAEHSVDGSIHFVFMDWRHMGELLTAGMAVYAEHKNLYIWCKDNAGMGSFYRSQHELVFVFKKGTAPHLNNFGLGEHGRYRTNVWRYPGVNSPRAGRLDDLRMHPTVKPVALVADAIRDCSTRGGIVLDSFDGSGTTLIAAEKTARRAYTMELDPRYVDTAVRRWESYTGGAAVHETTGLTFAEVAAAREHSSESDGQNNPPGKAGRSGQSGR